MHEVSHFGRRFALITLKNILKGVKRKEEKILSKLEWNQFLESETLSFSQITYRFSYYHAYQIFRKFSHEIRIFEDPVSQGGILKKVAPLSSLE